MTFNQALTKLVSGEKDRIALSVVYKEVEPLCQTRTNGNNGEETTLWDWLAEGEYHLSDTPQSLADEWDTAGKEK